MKFAKFVAAACLAAVPMLASQAWADGFSKTEDAVGYRQGSFRLLSHHMGTLNPMMRGQVPFDAAKVQQEVALIKTLSALPWKAFGEGREGGKADKSIWSDNAKFKQLAGNFEAEVDKLVAASKTGEYNSVRAAFAGMVDSCKTCHSSFRNR